MSQMNWLKGFTASWLSEWLKPKAPAPSPKPAPAPAATAGAVGHYKRLTVERLEIRGGTMWAALISHADGQLAIELIDQRATPMAMAAAVNIRQDGSLLIRLRHEGQLFELPIAALKFVADAYSEIPPPVPAPPEDKEETP